MVSRRCMQWLPAMAALVVVVGCGGGGGGGSDDGTTRAVIGAAGGTLQTADGLAKVVVPAGAVAAATTFTAKALAAPPADPNLVPGTAWELSASGAVLASAVQITLRYDPAKLPAGSAETDLEMATVDGGAWVSVPGSTVDPVSDTVSASVTHLSGWGIRRKQKAGEWIWFQMGELYRIHPDGTGLEVAPKPKPGGTPGPMLALSADGQRMITTNVLGDTFECGPDGTPIRQLTALAGAGLVFGYSPDGTRLYCQFPIAEGGALFTVNSDGTNRIRVVPSDLIGTPGGVYMWTPGKLLYRWWESPNHNGNFMPGIVHWRTCNADGSGVTELIGPPDAEFTHIQSVSSAGEILAYVGEEQGGNYVWWLATVTAGTPPGVTKIKYFGAGANTTQARWSPTGTEIAYCYQGKLYRSPAGAGATPTLVYAPPGDNATGVAYWTP